MSSIQKSTAEDTGLIRELLQRALGLELYYDVYEKLYRILSDESFEYKIFLARKGFALYRAFEPVLREDMKSSDVNICGNIIHDRAYSLYINKMTKDTTVLVVDDVILFGRTMGIFVNDLSKRVNRRNINIYAIIGDKTLLCKGSKGKFLSPESDDYVKWILTDKETDDSIATYQPICLNDGLYVRAVSAKYMEAIHSVSIPYETYSVAYTIHRDSWSEILIEKLNMHSIFEISDFKPYIKEKFLNEYVYDNTTFFDQKQNGVSSFSLTKSFSSDKGVYLCVRFYINPYLGIIRIVPNVSMPELCNSNGLIDSLYNKYINEPLENFDVENTELLRIKYRLLHYVLKHSLGLDFMDEMGIKNYSIFFTNSFEISDLFNTWKKLPVIDFINDMPESNVNQKWESKKIPNLPLQNEVAKKAVLDSLSSFDSNLEINDIISRFCWHDVLYDTRESERREGESLCSFTTLFYNEIGKYCKNIDNLKEKIISNIFSLCDQARLAIYVFSKEDMASLLVRVGEQAIQYNSRKANRRDGFDYSIITIKESLDKISWEKNREYLSDVINKYIDKNEILKRAYPQRDIKHIIFESEAYPKYLELRSDLEKELENNPDVCFFLGLTQFFPLYIKMKEKDGKLDFYTYLKNLQIPENRQTPVLAALMKNLKHCHKV